MRVALINPKFRLPIDTRTSPHLGLAYLAAVSQQRGDEVRVYDADVEQQPHLCFHLVDVLAARPGAARELEPQLGVVDLHLVVDSGHDAIMTAEVQEGNR